MARAKVVKNYPYNEANLREPRKNRVIVLENLNFIFDEYELKDIKKMWNLELSVSYMSEYLNRDSDEILLALIHLAREDRITRRKAGLLVDTIFNKG
jgi:hypothetical protein